MYQKYSDEQLKEAVVKSNSIMDVLRYLGISTNAGTSHTHISKRVKTLALDISHFKPNRKKYLGGNKPRIATEVLVLKTFGCQERTKALRRALIEIGREYVCECGQPPWWNGKLLVLQIEHKNGDNLDDRPENLTFLCPNCHTQTSTYGLQKHLSAPVV